MRRFEYKIDYDLNEKSISNLGSLGWELVSVQRDFKDSCSWFYFKRETL